MAEVSVQGAALFSLRRPCPHCPFRTDVPAYLRGDRAAEIARSIAGGALFSCHETTVPDEDDDSVMTDGPGSKMCAGAMLVMLAEEAPNQALRMAERFGYWDADAMDTSAPTFRSFAQFVRHHAGDDDGFEACCYSGPGCEAPAGFLVDGVAVPATSGGETFACELCGEPVCGECAIDGVCPSCVDEQTDDDE